MGSFQPFGNSFFASSLLTEPAMITSSPCFQFAGVTEADKVQITPGFGLWTAGLGFQAGAERLGAMVIPTGAGNTDVQKSRDVKKALLDGAKKGGDKAPAGKKPSAHRKGAPKSGAAPAGGKPSGRKAKR